MIQTQPPRRFRWNLTITMVLFIFGMMMSAIILSAIVGLVLHLTGVLNLRFEPDTEHHGNPLAILVILFLGCALLGTAIAAFIGRRALKPLRRVIAATQQVAGGDFSVRVNLTGIPELEDLSNSFNQMAEQLGSVESMRRDFINDFSHEFRTPITSVRGYAKLLRDKATSEADRQAYTDIIIAESERLARLSTNVLALETYENTQIITNRTTFRVDEQIRRVVTACEPTWAPRNITMEVDLDEVTMVGNQDLIQQIWVNLVDNAIKFSPDNSVINLELTSNNGELTFKIRDEGIGMDEATQSRIFDRFYQGDTSRTRPGNGLGLPIVKRIADLCGGTIRVTSAPEQGSEFTVTLRTNDRQ